eukprot:58986_1
MSDVVKRERLKYVDHTTHHLLYGFIHQSEAIQETCSKKKTVYGNFKIESSLNSICIWTFKILHLTSSYEMNTGSNENIYIGIDSSNKDNIHIDFSEGYSARYKYFAWGSDQAAWYNGDFNNYGTAFNNNDIVQMEINTQNKSLKYYLNGIDQDIAFTRLFSSEIDEFYYLAIALDNKDTSIQLLRFQLTPIL